MANKTENNREARKRLLIVEDNAEFREGAERFFKGVAITPVYAGDFLQFEDIIKQREFDGIITDCFFPYQTGSDQKAKGLEAIEKMKAVCPSRKNPVALALWKSYEQGMAEGGLRLFCENSGVDFDKVADSYLQLDMAIKQSEANQPLGIFVAEQAQQIGIPFVLATSTNHHDTLTEPIVRYCGAKRWILVDCARDSVHQKASPEFWERAYSELERRMEEAK